MARRRERGEERLEGPVQRTAGGAGFFLLPTTTAAAATETGLPPKELYIAPDDMRGALDGDTVRVKMVSRRRRGGGRCGQVEQILERATTTFVGRYYEQGGRGWVRVDGTLIDEPVVVGDPGARSARPGDQVVLEMLTFPTWNQRAAGVLVEVLGPRGQPGVDLETVIREFGLPDEFPENVLEEARVAAAAFVPGDLPGSDEGRRDLSAETIVTIDPVDARDFDDAISLSELDEGGWRLGVHIADVSHFVPPGGALDEEARRRGTSVYLPGRVLPMLPELISNGLASLQQGEPRLAVSIFLEMTAAGIVQHVEFVRSVITVARRFSYEQVSELLEDPDHLAGRVALPIRELLVRMHRLSRILRKRRFSGGAIELQLPELKVELDQEGRVEAVREVVQDESHQVIEEFMLAANTAVATELTDRGLIFLRRVHPEPSYGRLKNFSAFVGGLGFRLDRFQSRTELQRLLERVADGPLAAAVNYALLRSMKQAEYSGREEGHYALGIENYCHFTSPIRRYPDLVVHRMITALAEGGRPRGLAVEQSVRLGRQCSLTERRAEKAERTLVRLKLLMFLKERIGETIDAVVIGVEKFGVICRGVAIPVEALVHVSELDENDFFDFDRYELTLTGRRSGRSFRLGDSVRVKLAAINLDERSVRMEMDRHSGLQADKKGTRSRTGRHSKSEDRKRSGRRGRGRGGERRGRGGGRGGGQGGGGGRGGGQGGGNGTRGRGGGR